MNAFRIKYLVSISIYTLFMAFIILLQSTGLATFQLGTASAVLSLPLVLYAAFYFGPYGACVLGFLAGAATDAFSSTFTYNTVFMTALGFLAGLLMSHYFNRNIAAAAVVNFGGSAIYFFLKWLFVYAFSDPSAGFVLTKYILPSFLYTAVLGFVLFFPINLIFKKITLRQSK